MPASVGQLLGNYRVVSALPPRAGQQSGMCAYAVEHIHTHLRGVLIMPATATIDPFFHLARGLFLARDPALAEILDFDQLPDGTPYFIREHLEGETVRQRLGRFGRIPELAVLLLGQQLVAAMLAAHRKGMAPLGLHPDRVILIADPAVPGEERVKLVPGPAVATAESEAGDGVPRHELLAIQTGSYLAPEQHPRRDSTAPAPGRPLSGDDAATPAAPAAPAALAAPAAVAAPTASTASTAPTAVGEGAAPAPSTVTPAAAAAAHLLLNGVPLPMPAPSSITPVASPRARDVVRRDPPVQSAPPQAPTLSGRTPRRRPALTPVAAPPPWTPPLPYPPAPAGPPGEKADVFALGLLLYEMLSGWHPLGGLTTWDPDGRARPPEPLRKFVPTLREDTERLVLSLLARAPRERPGMAQVQNELGRLLSLPTNEPRPRYDSFGRYQVVAKLGEGGMGTVFQAVSDDTDLRVAIKVLHPELAQLPQILARFCNEARTANRVRHPGIVTIYELGRPNEGPPYIVMEFLDGESLATRILHRGAAARRGEVLWLFREVAEVMMAAHDKGVIHRDLKPENVMVVKDPFAHHGERVKILDFGIAKVTTLFEAPRGGELSRTQSGTVLGTPLYMAPEQCRGASTLSEKVDVYALGVMLYQALSGRVPFMADGPGEVMAQHLHGQPQPLSQVVPGVAPDLEALVHAMLAKDPADRPPMKQVRNQLRWLEQPAADPEGRRRADELRPDSLRPEGLRPDSGRQRGDGAHRAEGVPRSDGVPRADSARAESAPRPDSALLHMEAARRDTAAQRPEHPTQRRRATATGSGPLSPHDDTSRPPPPRQVRHAWLAAPAAALLALSYFALREPAPPGRADRDGRATGAGVLDSGAAATATPRESAAGSGAAMSGAAMSGAAGSGAAGSGAPPAGAARLHPAEPPRARPAGDWTLLLRGRTDQIYGLFGTAHDDLFAVGAGGVALHHDGHGWEAMPTGTTRNLLGVWGQGRDVFIVGEQGTLLHTDRTGPLHPMRSPGREHLNAVWGSRWDNVYAVGDGVVERYDGHGWRRTPLPGQVLHSVWGTGNGPVFAVGAGGVVLRLDGPQAAAETVPGIPGAGPKGLLCVFGSGPTEVFAMGQDGLALRYNGAGWSLVNSAALTGVTVYALWARRPGDFYAVGHDGTAPVLLQSDGRTWWRTPLRGESLRQLDRPLELYALWGVEDGAALFAGGKLGAVLRWPMPAAPSEN